MASGGDSKLAAITPYCYECVKSGRFCPWNREELEQHLKDNPGFVCCTHAVSDHRSLAELKSSVDLVASGAAERLDRRRVNEWTVEEVGLFVRSLAPQYELPAGLFASREFNGEKFVSDEFGGVLFDPRLERLNLSLGLLQREWNELRRIAGRKPYPMKLADLSLIVNRVRLPASEQGNMSCVETAIFSDRKVIIKTLLRPDESYDIKQFRAEIDALKSVKSHAFSSLVVELIAYCESPLAPVLEWCEGGTLYSHVSNNPKLSWTTRLELLIDITGGLLALHKREWETDEPSTSRDSSSEFSVFLL